jgi:hypothetical protein
MEERGPRNNIGPLIEIDIEEYMIKYLFNKLICLSVGHTFSFYSYLGREQSIREKTSCMECGSFRKEKMFCTRCGCYVEIED